MPSTPEADARIQIDQQLTAAGWAVQNVKEINLHAQLGVAIREFPTATGPADYMLFADGKAIGIVEAKKVGETLSAVHAQASRYGSSDAKHIQRWQEPLPFTYETTGVETYFTDERDPTPRARRVFCFHRPEELIARVKEPDTLRARLTTFPELVTAPLRECQIDAISSLEKSLSENRPRSLIQMATGSGKTYTAVTTAYRLIKHAGAKRILFLVDRGNLGRQTVNEFQQFTTPDDGRKFTELYNVQMLGPAGIDPVAKVTVSTIQRLYSQLAGKDLDEDLDERSGYEVSAAHSSLHPSQFTPHSSSPVPISYNPRIPIEEFDFVIVDECHRSIYNLWKQVLEYFDAFLIGLTATPSKHTLGFFNQNLVTEYPHVQAVADGVNVGYDIYRIRTQITESGSALESGFEYKKRDRLTRAERWKLQDEEETYSNRDLDRSVTSHSQIRTVIRTFREKLFTDLFPSRPARAASLGFDEPWVPKTLIFAKDDNHAEEIVTIVREEFAKGNDFCQKITYRAGAKPEDLIKAFRTAPEFRIAVTVDMIATGTDIKPLECLLFMRDVRSQLYFEQMKGRGTRTIDPTDFQAVTPDAGNKTHFVLVDAVGVTESDKTDSRPLERKPTIAFDKLLLSIAMGARDPDTLSSAANRLARLDRNLTESDRDQVRELTGGLSVKQIASNLLQATDPDNVEAASRRFQSTTFYNPLAPVEITSANLPHWQQDGATYFLTFRLVDSLPQERLAQWTEERTLWLKTHPQPLNGEDKAEYNERFTVVMEDWLDQGNGSCLLNIPECRTIVENALRHFDEDRYQLGEYAIASNHVHVLVTPADGINLSEVLHSWKSFTAKEIIKVESAAAALTDHWQTLYDRRREAARGCDSSRYAEVKYQRPVWQKESYDHIVRSPESLHKIQEYILNHSRSGVPPLSSPTAEEQKRRDAASTQLANEAAKPIASNPALRELLDRKRRDTEMTLDHASVDTVLSAAYDTEKAEQLIQSWTQFIEANKDELTALQIIYNLPTRRSLEKTKEGRPLYYQDIKELAAAVSKPPYNIAPEEVWRAYENLEGRKPTDNPVRTLTNLITLVRHSIQPDTVPLVPYTQIVNQRFEKWLAQQSRSGVPPLSPTTTTTPLSPSDNDKRRDVASTDNKRQDAASTPFSEDHLDWLHMIKDHIATSAAIEPDDFEDVPFNQKGGLAKARKLFGKELKEIIDNLNEVLVG